MLTEASAKKEFGGGLDRVGQLHAADLVVLRRAEHARLDIGLVRLVRGLRQDHLLAVEARLLDVDRAVVRRVFLAGDPLAGVEHRIEGLARMVGEALARSSASSAFSQS